LLDILLLAALLRIWPLLLLGCIGNCRSPCQAAPLLLLLLLLRLRWYMYCRVLMLLLRSTLS
jgi:hypothetical protein